jgi:hypothetical protein
MLTVCGILVLALAISGCSISGDDDDPATATADVAPPTQADSIDPTATELASPTEPASATATETTEPTATSSPTATASSTATASATATELPEVENPFANVPQPDTVLENFTLSYQGEFGPPQGETESLEIFIEQSAPTRYHLRAAAGVEIWVIEDATYFRNPDGSVFQIQSAIDPVLVSPAAYLIQIPDPADVPSALQVGQDDVDGRSATHYQVEADQVGRFGLAQDQTITDPDGEIEIWVDDELGFISRMLVDVEWTDETGSRQSAVAELLITAVGTTQEIQAPI